MAQHQSSRRALPGGDEPGHRAELQKLNAETEQTGSAFCHPPGEAMRELTRGEAEDQRGNDK